MSSYSSYAFALPTRVPRVPLPVVSGSGYVCRNGPVATLRDSVTTSPAYLLTRREFLSIAAVVVAKPYLNKYVAKAETGAGASSVFSLPPLPYSYDALEPHISSQIMHAHHDSHFATYVEKLNKAVNQLPSNVSVSSDQELVDLLKRLDSISDDSLKTAVRNNGGGYLNHKLFFSQMAPTPSQLPDSAPLALAIRRKFGSFDQFKTEFLSKAAALFGSGFTWLIKNKDGSVSIIQTPNQDNPAMQKLQPVLACDCWEHSWYYQYGPKKKDYLTSWWNVVDWSVVNDVFENA